MKFAITLTVAATIFAGSASAFDPDDLQKLKNTNKCVACNLTGADLEAANLKSVKIKYATLWGANLTDANLMGADLSGADLSFAIMKGAILCNTTMPDGSVIYSGC